MSDQNDSSSDALMESLESFLAKQTNETFADVTLEDLKKANLNLEKQIRETEQFIRTIELDIEQLSNMEESYCNEHQNNFSMESYEALMDLYDKGEI